MIKCISSCSMFCWFTFSVYLVVQYNYPRASNVRWKGLPRVGCYIRLVPWKYFNHTNPWCCYLPIIESWWNIYGSKSITYDICIFSLNPFDFPFENWKLLASMYSWSCIKWTFVCWPCIQWTFCLLTMCTVDLVYTNLMSVNLVYSGPCLHWFCVCWPCIQWTLCTLTLVYSGPCVHSPFVCWLYMQWTLCTLTLCLLTL